MPRSTRDIPPPLELLCLRTLWSIAEGNVNDVRRVVAESRPLAYTTIMTVLDRLVRKGMIVRRKVGRAFVYSPRASRDSMRRAAVRELLDGFFDGSEEELVRFLRGSEPRVEGAAAAGEGDAGIDTVLL
ncbi:MAG TPA: BlaI/MecI/CopY family transcriptional regulator [Bryobacteraceae bacterium]|nr:BlaI/MecI/CopY family transcriptional regulator [Bryobacteraceae bacterium]